MKPDPELQPPVISIQCDWDDVLFSSNKEVWVSCKFRGSDSTHSKLRGQGTSPPIFACDNFSVTNLSRNSLHIKHNASGFLCAFVPAKSVFSAIHKKKIVSLNVTQGGLGVSVCTDNKLAVWNSDTGETRRILEGHLGSVYKCKFFPSGIVVLSGGADMQLKIWSAETGQCPVTLIGHKASVNDFCIVEKGRNIISASKDGTAKLWDCGKATCLATITETKDTLNCCSIGEVNEGVTVEPNDNVSEREIGTKNKILLVGSEEGFVYGISVYNRKIIFTTNMNSAINVVLYLTKNLFAVGCQNGKIDLFNMANTNKPIKTYYESNSPVLSGCLYKENGFFVGRNDGTVTYYDCIDFSDTRIQFTGSDCDPIYDISCAGDRMFTACRDGKIRSYNVFDTFKNIFSY